MSDALTLLKTIAPYLGATEGNDWRGLDDDDAISMPVKMRVGDLRALKALSASPAPAGDLVERVAGIIRALKVTDYDSADDIARALIPAMQPGWRDKPHCQSCGGEIQGWTCQGCGLTFRENEAGRLVAEPLPAPLGVGG